MQQLKTLQVPNPLLEEVVNLKIIIIGQGGHSKVISDIIFSNSKNEIIGYLDDIYKNVQLLDNHFCGPISEAKKVVETIRDIKFIIGIGNNKIRKSIAGQLNLPVEYYANVIHPSAII